MNAPAIQARARTVDLLIAPTGIERSLSPEMQAEVEALRRRDAVRISHAVVADRLAMGSAVPALPRAPGELEPMSLDRLIAEAEANIARRNAFRKSPEGRFKTALGEMDTLLIRAFGALDVARSARDRDFDANREQCRTKADELFEIAKLLQRAALDASLATDGAA